MKQNTPSHHLSGTWRVMLLSLHLFVLLSLAGCNNGPPEWKDVLTQATPTPTPASTPAIETTNELVIYLDTSASMAGYVTKDGQSVFGKTLRELRFATGTFANSDAKVLVRRIASDVGRALADMELTSASQAQNIYRGGETNLAGAIQSFRGATTPSPNPPAQTTSTKVSASDSPKPNPIPKFHILVTDGVQSNQTGKRHA